MGLNSLVYNLTTTPMIERSGGSEEREVPPADSQDGGVYREERHALSPLGDDGHIRSEQVESIQL